MWAARDDGGELVGVGALKELEPGHGEVKSMRTAPRALGRGVGRAVLHHIVGEAQSRGYRRLSLETGGTRPFEAAISLYESEGFTRCGPFAGYADTRLLPLLHPRALTSPPEEGTAKRGRWACGSHPARAERESPSPPNTCIAAPPARGRATHGGVRGNPLQRPVFRMGQIPVSGALARVETSGGIRASLAGRYASALFDLARDERQIDAVGRSLEALRQALADSRDFAELGRQPAGRPRRRPARRSPPLAPQLCARPDHDQFPRRPRAQRPQEPASAGHPRLPPARRRASRRDDRGGDHRAAAEGRPDRRAQGSSFAPAPAATSRSKPQVDPEILGGIVVKLGSQMIDASIRTKLNRLAQAMKG